VFEYWYIVFSGVIDIYVRVMAQIPSPKRMDQSTFKDSTLKRPIPYFHQLKREDSPEEPPTRYFDQSTDEEKFATIVKTKCNTKTMPGQTHVLHPEINFSKQHRQFHWYHNNANKQI